MACDEGLVDRIRDALRGARGIGEIRMFGGVCFTLNGNMMCGVVKDDLMCRIGEAAYEPALKRAHVREMDFAKRPMRGYVFVDSEGLAEDEDLRSWVEACRTFVGNMPIKEPKVKAKPTAKVSSAKLGMPRTTKK
jgi:TfoX/Sxy family transcriptional regulator of competence genes